MLNIYVHGISAFMTLKMKLVVLCIMIHLWFLSDEKHATSINWLEDGS
jgi:hypothetical protein